jgi:phenylacetic acid degradation protein
MLTVIMDRVVIGEESLVGATAFVKTDFSCPARSMVTGNPARIRRQLSDKEVAWKTRGKEEYQALVRRSLATLRTVKPLSEAQADRRRFAHSTRRQKNQT